MTNTSTYKFIGQDAARASRKSWANAATGTNAFNMLSFVIVSFGNCPEYNSDPTHHG
jgi:hypothetical protein